MTYSNLQNNPSKRPEVRQKISELAKSTNRQKQMMTPEARKKAIPKISKALTGKSHSPETIAAISRGVRLAGCCPPRNPHLVGKNHWNWKGGHSTVRNKAFNSPEYRRFRDTILKRDNYVCQKCKKRGGRLHVHHIKSWGEHPKLRYDTSNGMVVCKKCHYAIHRNNRKPVTLGPRILAHLPSNQDVTS